MTDLAFTTASLASRVTDHREAYDEMRGRRDDAIRQCHAEGMSCQKIADITGMSRARIIQICDLSKARDDR